MPPWSACLMAQARPFLSKSRLISAAQCPKKVHLEKHHPELGVITAQMESAFAGGHEVGDIAQQLYGTEESVEVAFDFKTMVADTRRLIEDGVDFPIFEATFRHENVLVRADIMIPEGDGWHVIEVKASTSVKDYHVLDCAIQDWVLQNCGINVLSISLAHINNQFVYQGDGNYEGLLLEHDLTEQVRAMEYEVLELVATAREAVSGPLPMIDVSPHCNKPYKCQFISYCRPAEDVSGEPELTPGAREILEALPYPRYYLDFETIGPAIPIWAGTRPYAALPIQWSCHIEEKGGDLRHEEFLDLSGEAPMRALAERMIECLGESGPVLMYTTYERTVINGLIGMFPDLEAPLTKIVNRLWDLHPLVKAHYYHPAMLGSWSIKAVLPCIVPHMDYAELEGIKEGTGAADGFLEAIHPQTDTARKAELEEQLQRYCRFDTEAMVEIVRALSVR
jgi:hypothetical protein